MRPTWFTRCLARRGTTTVLSAVSSNTGTRTQPGFMCQRSKQKSQNEFAGAIKLNANGRCCGISQKAMSGSSALPASLPSGRFLTSSLNRAFYLRHSRGSEAGDPLDDPKKQHRLRRTVCKGSRDKQWYGRMLAFIELLAGDSAFIQLPLGEEACVKLDEEIRSTSPSPSAHSFLTF